LGYIADPTLLRRKVRAFFKTRRQHHPPPAEINRNDDEKDFYFDLLNNYHVEDRTGVTGTWSLEMEPTCNPPGAQGPETVMGYEILAKKIRIANLTTTATAIAQHRRPRLLCLMYTHSKMRDLARSMALTWGWKCDGFLAFSTETLRHFGMVDLVHVGPETYKNMWQKTRAIWGYVGKHYMDDYDYFHLVRFQKKLYSLQKEKDTLLTSIQWQTPKMNEGWR